MNSLTKLGILLPLCLGVAFAVAEENLPEKANVVKNDAVRAAKKAIHRTEELVCLKGDVKCLTEKAKNRIQETKEAAEDKLDEVKNKVDGK